MKNKMKKVICVIATLTLLLSFAAIPVFAASPSPAPSVPDIAGALGGLKDAVMMQGYEIYSNIAVPIFSAILIIVFFFVLGKEAIRYRRDGGNFDWIKPALLLGAIIVLGVSSPIVLAIFGG